MKVILFLLIFLLSFAQNSYAGILDLVLETQETGTAAFDAGTCDTATSAGAHVSGTTYIPGKDVCAGDTVVRTNDYITYAWNYSSNSGATNNVTITQTLPAGMEWVSLPPQCTTGSSISLDGLTITCNVGTVPSGTTALLTPQARVKGTVANADILSTNAEITGDAAVPVTSNTVETIVSSAPQWQVEKQQTSAPRLAYFSDGTTLGYLFTYYTGIFADNLGKGTEVLASPITFTDTVTYSAGPNNSQLYTWGPDGSDACELVGAPSTAFNSFSTRPFGSRALTSGGNAPRAVEDSGTITCTQAGGPGTAIGIEFAGTDSSLEHIPTNASGGGTLPANRAYIASGVVKIWVPLTDIGGGIGVTNTYEDFDPDSVTGQSNYGPNPGDIEPDTDNSVAFPLTLPPSGPGQGSTSKAFVLSGTKGTYRVLAGQQFETRVSITNTGSDDLTDIILCDKFDNSVLALSNTANPVGYVSQAGLNPSELNYFDPANLEIEYSANANWATPQQMRDATCEDGDGPWESDPDNLPGGRDAATKARVKVINNAPLTAVQRQLDFYVRVKARSGAMGTVIPNFGSTFTTELNGGAWRHEIINANQIYTAGQPVGDLSDRAILNLVNARVNKVIVLSGGGTTKSNTFVAGQEVTYRLIPTVTTSNGDPYATSATLVDTIPAGLEYVAGSASLTPDSVVPGAGGTTVLTWTLTGLQANVAIPPIEFRALVPLYAPNLSSHVNCVDISSPDDETINNPNATCGSGTRPLSSAATVLVSNPTAFFVTKYVDTPLIQVDETLQFRLAYRNVSTNSLASTDIIDILPFNGDGSDPGPDGIPSTIDDFVRVPPSDYNGTLSFVSISGSFGEVFQYTKHPKNQINRDPGHASNGIAGTTVWCNTFSGGTCPASASEVTAVRSLGGLLPAASELRELVLILSTSQNREGDIYTNNFGARAQGLALPVYSPDVTVTVLEGKIGNQVFRDTNGDGVFQPGLGELGIAGVTLELYEDANGNGIVDAGDTLVQTTTTDANGEYLFERLRVDDGGGSFPYLVRVTDNNGVLADFSHTNGIAGVDSNSQNQNGYAVTLTPTVRDNMTADFGYMPLGRLGDYVWFDSNQNGIQDNAEPGVENVTVHLLDNAQNILKSTATGPDGRYLFTGLLPGTYAVQFVLPDGRIFTKRGSGTADDSDADTVTGVTSFVTLGPGGVNLNLDAGLIEACVEQAMDREPYFRMDSGAAALTRETKKVINLRNPSKSSECEKMSKSQYRKSLQDIEELNNRLWTDVWTQLPMNKYICSSSTIPSFCKNVSTTDVSSGISNNGKKIYNIGIQQIKKCSPTKRIKSYRKKLDTLWKNLNTSVSQVESEIIMCS